MALRATIPTLNPNETMNLFHSILASVPAPSVPEVSTTSFLVAGGLLGVIAVTRFLRRGKK
jgi:hypothetical protein